MRIQIANSAEALGEIAAAEAAAKINQAIDSRGSARVVFSTGRSQLETLRALGEQRVQWSRVHGFHLDEYCALPPDHPSSFRTYLRKELGEKLALKMNYVEPEDPASLATVAEAVSEAMMDVSFIGIGENGHLGFNDPPAQLAAVEPFIEVALAESCKQQQVREGWFSSTREVPERAVTMSIPWILRTHSVFSCVPGPSKATIIATLLETTEVTPELPASALRQHPDVTIYLDRSSAGLLPDALVHELVVN
ncbi:MAG: 6-phosphogluconolactonase [Acidimicrobiales bacterium]